MCLFVNGLIVIKIVSLFFIFQGKLAGTVVCWFLGLGTLVAWNSMLTIGDYYYELFPVCFYPR